jgi:DNA (cytosine-5)-methyltransferase 1
MTRSGTLFRLVPLVRRTAGTASGSSAFVAGLVQKPTHHVPTPTPSASGFECADVPKLLARRERCKAKHTNGNGFGLTLNQAVKVAMWPTPKASAAGPDFAKVGRSKTGISLATAVAMFPTPAATDGKGAGKTGTLRDRLDYAVERGATKSKTYQQPPQDGGSLNPTWVEWLMGFPLGWTALDASETPSSRKSSRSSGGRSSRTKNG